MRFVNRVFLFVALLVLSGRVASSASPSTEPQASNNPELKALVQRSSDLQNLIDKYRQEQANCQERMSSVREQIAKATDEPGITPELVRQDVGRLVEQREQLEMEAAGANGRRDGLEKAIAHLSHRLEERVKSDPVAKELEKAAGAREQQVKLLEEQFKTGQITQADVLAAQAALAQAKAELEAARQHAGGAGSLEALDAWDRELLRLSVDGQERQARLQYINERLRKLAPALDDVVDLERTSEHLALADKLLRQAEDERDKLELQIQQ